MADCNKNKQNVSETSEAAEAQEKLVQEKFENEIPQPHFLKGDEGKQYQGWMNNYLISKHGTRNGKPWTSKQWRDAVTKAFNAEESGGKNLQKKYPGIKINNVILATEIIAVLNDKIWMQDIVNTMYWELFPEWRPVISKNMGGSIDLATLPLTSLKIIYNEVLYVASAQDKGGNINGALGYMRFLLNTPKQFAKHAGSEGYYELADGLQRYNENISSIIKDFTTVPKNLILKDKDGKKIKIKRDYGVQDIYNGLNNLSLEIQDESLYENEIHEAVVAMFTRLAVGWMYVDSKTKQLMINSEYKGTGKTYKSTGDSITALMNPVKLEDYTTENKDLSTEVINKIRIDKLGNMIRSIWMSMDDKSKEIFMKGKEKHAGMEKLVEMFRPIDSQAGLFAHQQVQESHNEIVLALVEMFDGVLDVKSIRKIFFEKDYKNIDEYKSLSKENRDTVDLLYDTFSKQSMMSVVSTSATDISDNPNFKNNHFPVQYFQENQADMWEQVISDMNTVIPKLQDELEGLVGTERIAMKDEIARLEKVLKHALLVKQNWMDDKYGYDVYGDKVLPIAKDNVYVKHVTGMFDIRNMRQDQGAYLKYLRDVASTIERNRLTANLIRSLSKENRPHIRDGMINMYKGPFGRTDTVGGAFFWRGSPDSYSDRIGNILSGKQLHRFFQLTNSAISGRYLSRLGTAAQNYSAIVHSIHDYGMTTYVDAIKALRNHKDAIYEMIDASGIIDFSDYYSAQLVNDLAGVQVEAYVQKIIIGAMINYHGRLSVDNSVKGKKDAEVEFRANIQRALEESRVFQDTIIIPEDINEIIRRQKDNKFSRMRFVINKYVDWAITKKFEYNKVYETDLIPTFERVAYGGLSRMATIWEGLFGGVGPLRGLTMAETEKSIRVISFVIGIQRAMQPGGPIKKTAFNKLTGKDYDKAVEIGRIHSRNTNYGMTSQDVGQISQGDIGNSTTKFKIWGMQNWGKDQRRFKRFFQSLKSMESVDDQRIDWSVIIKMWPELWKSNKKLRSSNPAAAQFKSFIVLSGIFTLAATAMLGPLAIPIVRKGLGYLGVDHDVMKYMGSAYSDFLAVTVIMPLMFGMMLMTNDDDEDFEWVSFLQSYLRKSFLGWGPIYTLDLFLNFAKMMTQDGFGPAQYGQQILSPILISPFIDQITRKAIAKPIDAILAE